MTGHQKYYEVRRYPDDPWDYDNLLWRCDTKEEADRRMEEFVLRGMNRDNMFIIEGETTTWKGETHG